MKVYGFYTGNEVIEIGIDEKHNLFMRHPKITDNVFRKFSAKLFSKDIEQRKKAEVMLRVLKKKIETYDEADFDNYVISDIQDKLGFEFVGKKNDTT